MNITLLITFIVLSIVNVILQTVKSIVTVKCGKFSASIVNAVAFGLYTIVTVSPLEYINSHFNSHPDTRAIFANSSTEKSNGLNK